MVANTDLIIAESETLTQRGGFTLPIEHQPQFISDIVWEAIPATSDEILGLSFIEQGRKPEGYARTEWTFSDNRGEYPLAKLDFAHRRMKKEAE